MGPWTAVVVQFDLEPAAPARNVEKATRLADALPERPDLVLLPELSSTVTAWTGHWELLLRARAVENGLFVLGANRVGEQASQVFEGAGQVVDPWGEVLAHAGAAECAVAAVVDPARVEKVRRRIPVLEDRVAGVDGSIDP